MKIKTLSTIALVLTQLGLTSVATGQEQPLREEAVELRGLRLTADHREEKVRGLRIDFDYRVGKVDIGDALFLVARLRDAKTGKSIPALVKSASLRDKEGSLHGKKQIIGLPGSSFRAEALFIPFYAMKLDPGPHSLEVELEAVGDPGQCKQGLQPHKIAMLGTSKAQVRIVKPPYRMVQLLVSHAEVTHDDFDSALWPWSRLPDLKWRARFQAGPGGVVFTSAVRDNSRSASWSTYSPSFPFSQGDALTISILDQDAMSSETIGSVDLSLEELLDGSAASKLHSADKVTSLRIAPVKIR